MTYLILQNRIADETARSDLTTQIQYAILSAIEHYKDERFWFNEFRDTASTASGTQNYLMPDSASERPLIRADQLTITISSRIQTLTQRSHQWIVDRTTSSTQTGYPSEWSYYQDSIWLYPIPNGTYTLTLWYVGQLATLSADGDSNGWTEEAEALIRCRAKWDLYTHVIRDYAMADRMMAAEMNELNTLRGRRDMRLASEVSSWL